MEAEMPEMPDAEELYRQFPEKDQRHIAAYIASIPTGTGHASLSLSVTATCPECGEIQRENRIILMQVAGQPRTALACRCGCSFHVFLSKGEIREAVRAISAFEHRNEAQP